MIETGRLSLRPFRDEDRAAMAEINGHPEVGAWLGRVRDRAGSDAWIDTVNADIARQAYGFWAAERKADRRLVGAIGILRMTDDLPEPGALELAWRLHPDAQGQGLATEGAIACRDYVFDVLDEPLVTAMTATGNVRSRQVMERAGLTYQSGMDFDHPRLPPGHPLLRHVLYALRR